MKRGREEYPSGSGLGIRRAGGQAGCPQRDGAGVGHVWTGMDRYGQTCDDGAGEGGAQGSADSHLPPPSKGET